MEEYDDEQYYDYEQDWVAHPWNIHEFEEPFSKQQPSSQANITHTIYPFKQQQQPQNNQRQYHRQTNITAQQQFFRDHRQTATTSNPKLQPATTSKSKLQPATTTSFDRLAGV